MISGILLVKQSPFVLVQTQELPKNSWFLSRELSFQRINHMGFVKYRRPSSQKVSTSLNKGVIRCDRISHAQPTYHYAWASLAVIDAQIRVRKKVSSPTTRTTRCSPGRVFLDFRPWGYLGDIMGYRQNKMVFFQKLGFTCMYPLVAADKPGKTLVTRWQRMVL